MGDASGDASDNDEELPDIVSRFRLPGDNGAVLAAWLGKAVARLVSSRVEAEYVFRMLCPLLITLLKRALVSIASAAFSSFSLPNIFEN